MTQLASPTDSTLQCASEFNPPHPLKGYSSNFSVSSHLCFHFPQLFSVNRHGDRHHIVPLQTQKMSERLAFLTAGCVLVCERQMIVSFGGISARFMYHLPFGSSFTHFHHSWFVLEKGHILFTSSTLKQLHLWVFPPLLCSFLSKTSRND